MRSPRVLRPLTYGMLRLGTSRTRKNHVEHPGQRQHPGGAKPPIEVPVAPPATEATDAVQEGQARELLRNLADFRETMVREVMTPRPDIIAIENDATIDQLITLYREQQYSRIPVFKETLDNVQGFIFIKDLIQRVGIDRRPDRAADSSGALRAGDQARSRPVEGVSAQAATGRHRR